MISHSFSFAKTLEKLVIGIDLDADESVELMNLWLAEEFQPVQTGALLAAFRSKGVSGSELSGMAKVLKQNCSIPCSLPDFFMVDTCGTGGDGAETFNISTAVAFVSAALGVKVAKHGNRSASGKIGSADVLEGLGISLNIPLEKVVSAIKDTNLTFLFAPAWHPSLVNLAPLRKSLGIRTLFNLLGPLVNPLGPQAQVLGVANSELLEPMSEALKLLGLKRAVIVHGAGGLDEASLQGDNYFRFLENGSLRTEVLSPLDLGLNIAPNSELKGENLEHNMEIMRSVLKGTGLQTHIDIVAFNTSLVLWASGLEQDLKSGVIKSLDCISSGKPWDCFNEFKSYLSS